MSYPALTTTAPALLRRLLALPFAALAVAALLACTSSGDGGMDLTDDFLDSGAHFEADASLRAPGDPNPRVEISMSEGDRTSFCLDVDAFRVANLYSVSFTLAFDGSQAELTSYAVGDLLGSDLLVSVDGSSDGQVIVGLTRQFPVHGMTGVSTSGGDPGHLIQLCFTIDGEGVERPVGFLPNLALEDFDGNSVGPTEWLGGLLTTAL